MASLATAWVDIVPRISDLQSAISKAFASVDVKAPAEKIGTQAAGGLSKGIESGMGKVGGVFGSLGKAALAGVFAVKGSGAVMAKTALDAYSDWEQAVGGVDTLFKDASGKLQGYAAQAYKTAGMSANQFMSTATSFAAALVSSMGGDVQAAADMANTAMQDMSDNANKMGTDADLIQQTYQSLARGNYAMLDNLKLGYGGTKAEMQRMIETANQWKAANGEAADLSIDSFADVVEAIHVVQQQLGITGTTAREAATTIEGSFNTLKASWSNWIAEAGKDNADMSAATQELWDSAATAASNAWPRIQQIAEGALKGIGAAGQEFLGSLTFGQLDKLGPVLPYLQQLADGLQSGAISAETLAKGAATLAGAFGGFALIGPQVGNILSALGGLGSAMDTVGGQLFGGLLTAGQSGLGKFGGMLTTFFAPSSILGFIGIAGIIAALLVGLGAIDQAVGGQLFAMIGTFFTTQMPALLTQLTAWVQANLPTLVAQGAAILTAILNGLTLNMPLILQAATTILTSLVTGIGAALPTLLPAVTGILLALVQGIVANLPTLLMAGLQLLTGLVQGIVNSIPLLIAALPNLITSFVNGIMTMLPQILETGVNLLLMLVNGIVNAIPQLIAALPQIISGFINGIGTHLPQIIETGLTLIGKLVVGLIKAIPKIVEAIPKLVTAIKDGFTSVDWGTIAKDIIDGIVNGIKHLAGDLWDAAKDAAKGALDGVKNLLGIHSPSRVFRDEVGVMIGLGMAEGIDSTQNRVVKSATALGRAALAAAQRSTAWTTSLWANGFENIRKTGTDFLMSQNRQLLAQALPAALGRTLRESNYGADSPYTARMKRLAQQIQSGSFDSSTLQNIGETFEDDPIWQLLENLRMETASLVGDGERIRLTASKTVGLTADLMARADNRRDTAATAGPSAAEITDAVVAALRRAPDMNLRLNTGVMAGQLAPALQSEFADRTYRGL